MCASSNYTDIEWNFCGISVECSDQHNVPSREEYHTLKIGCVSDINSPLFPAHRRSPAYATDRYGTLSLAHSAGYLKHISTEILLVPYRNSSGQRLTISMTVIGFFFIAKSQLVMRKGMTYCNVFCEDKSNVAGVISQPIISTSSCFGRTATTALPPVLFRNRSRDFP